jgi:hypothetical protein
MDMKRLVNLEGQVCEAEETGATYHVTRYDTDVVRVFAKGTTAFTEPTHEEKTEYVNDRHKYESFRPGLNDKGIEKTIDKAEVEDVHDILIGRYKGRTYEYKDYGTCIGLTRYDTDQVEMIPCGSYEFLPEAQTQPKHIHRYIKSKEIYEKLKGGKPAPEVEDTSFSDELGKLLSELEVLLQKKNADYGSSYDKSVEKYGEVVSLIRIGDKFNRIDNLIMSDSQGLVEEKIEETLLDLVGYGIIELVRRRRK